MMQRDQENVQDAIASHHRSAEFAAGVEHRTMDVAGKHTSDFPVDSPSQSSARYQYGGWGYRKHASQPRY